VAFHEHYEIDQVTGFLTPKKKSHLKNGFSATQKVEWLEVYSQSANFSKTCKLVGVSPRTVRDHFKGDDKFHMAYKAQQETFNHNVEETLYLAATKSKNVTAMFGWLRANYPKKYRESYVDKGPGKDERLKNILEQFKKEEKDEASKDSN